MSISAGTEPSGQPVDSDVLRERATFAEALRPGGITVQLLGAATLVSAPALYQFLVAHSITATTFAVRWVLITLGCWLVCEVARRYVALTSRPVPEKTPAKDSPGAAVLDEADLGLDDLPSS